MAENLKALFVVWSMLSLASVSTMLAAKADKLRDAIIYFLAAINVVACVSVIGIYFHG